METTSTLSGWTFFKNLTYIPAFVLGLSTEAYGILAVLMLIDTITGVIRSGTIHGWRSVTSHAAEVGLLAKLLLLIVPMVVALTARGAGLDLRWVASGALTVLIVSEGYSILGNIHSTYLRQDVKEFDAINFLLTKLRDTLERVVKKPAK
jgi:phage-related holin